MLIRNSARDAGLSDKYTPRYSGPYLIYRQTRAGTYVIQELDGTFMRQAVASFRLLPYSPRVPKDMHQESISESESESDRNSTSAEMSDPSAISNSSTDSADSDYHPH